MANTNDKITDTYNGTNPASTTVSSTRTAGVTTLACASLAGWPTVSKVHFATYKIDANSKKVAGSQVDWTGIVSGSNIGSLVVMNGTDAGSAIGDIVEMMPTAAWAHDTFTGLTKEHSQLDGSHTGINSTSITNVGNLTTTGTTSINGVWDGWIGANEAWTFASSTTITVPTNATTKYDVGDFIKITQSATVKYFVATNVAATLLTVAPVNGTDTVANSAITANAYSKARMPHGLPLVGSLPYNPYKFSVYRNAAWTTATSAFGKVSFDTELFDSNNNFSSGTYTVSVAGFYQFNACVYLSASGGAGYQTALYKNGSVIRYGGSNVPSVSFTCGFPVSAMLQLAAGDTIEVFFYSNGVAGATDEAHTWFNGFLVSAI